MSDSSKEYKGNPENLTIDEMKRVMNEFSRFEWPKMGFGIVMFTGGEPTTKFSTLIEAMNYCSRQLDQKLGVGLTTNGFIGAQGDYREHNKALLKSAGLWDLDAEQAVKILKDNGMTDVILSVDAAHTSMNGSRTKVPLDAVSSFLGALINNSYGKGEKNLKISSVFSKDDIYSTADLLNELCERHGLELDEHNRFVREGVNINLNGTNLFKIGNMYGAKTHIRLNLDEIFSFQCRRRSEELMSESIMSYYWYDTIDVGFDGTVYVCQSHTFPIGNIREDSLQEIVRRMEAREDHPKYGRVIEVMNIIQDLSTRRTWNNRCIGECLRLIYKVRPDLVENITEDVEACYTLGRNVEMQNLLIEQFHARKDELQAKIAEIDRKTEEKMEKQIEEQNKREKRQLEEWKREQEKQRDTANP
jgi:MoaA/NifB/PqqE/SkfB family radical SAM enzyme